LWLLTTDCASVAYLPMTAARTAGTSTELIHA